MTTKSSEPTFSSGDANALREIERKAIAQELAAFLGSAFDSRAEEFERVTALWASLYGGESPSHLIASRLLEEGERRISGDFFGRVATWSKYDSNERDDWARQAVQKLVRNAIPLMWLEMLESLKKSAHAFHALQTEARSAAAAFSETHSATLKPPPIQAEIDDLARRLFEALFLPTGPDELAMGEAAKTNLILSDAMREFEASRTRVQELAQEFGNGPETQMEAKRLSALTHARTFAFHWPTVVHEWQANNAAALGVRRALTGSALKKEAQSQTPEAAARLREAVATELARSEFVAAAAWPWPSEHEEVEADGMAAPLARLFVHLRARFCPTGKGPALARLQWLEREGRRKLAEWRAEGPDGIKPPASPWQALTPSLAASFVAQVVWFDRVGGELEREAASTTALVTTVHAGLGAIWRRDATQKEFNLLAASGESVAWLAVSSTESASHLFGYATTLTFHRLIRHLPEQSFRLWRSGRPDADITIEGGFSGLAEALGASSKRAAEEVKQALDLGASLRRTWANGSEARGLWTYVSRAAAPGRSASLTVTLSPIIRPQYAHQVPDGASRVLVPIVEIPALVGNRKSYGAQAALQWSVLARLVEGRAERAREGGVTFADSTWRALGAEAGLSGLQVFEVLKSWEGSFLERVGGERWNLANAGPYKAARRHLDEQAQLTSTASKRGLRAAAKRLKR